MEFEYPADDSSLATLAFWLVREFKTEHNSTIGKVQRVTVIDTKWRSKCRDSLFTVTGEELKFLFSCELSDFSVEHFTNPQCREVLA